MNDPIKEKARLLAETIHDETIAAYVSTGTRPSMIAHTADAVEPLLRVVEAAKDSSNCVWPHACPRCRDNERPCGLRLEVALAALPKELR